MTEKNRSIARRTFVLVHGGFHGGWCWRPVADRLSAAGHAVFRPTLTGLGARRHLLSPEITLTTHVDDVVNLVEAEELDAVILVGHSYAGAVISLVADRIEDRIQRLVYLDALIPKDGECVADYMPRYADKIRTASARKIGVAPPDVDFFGVPKGTPAAQWVERRLTPHPPETFLEAVRPMGAMDRLPKTYIVCTALRSGESPMMERVRTGSLWSCSEIETGHDAMVTAPDELARLLLE